MSLSLATTMSKWFLPMPRSQTSSPRARFSISAISASVRPSRSWKTSSSGASFAEVSSSFLWSRRVFEQAAAAHDATGVGDPAVASLSACASSRSKSCNYREIVRGIGCGQNLPAEEIRHCKHECVRVCVLRARAGRAGVGNRRRLYQVMVVIIVVIRNR